MSNYYMEIQTCLLHQLLVQICIPVTDMNPATIGLKQPQHSKVLLCMTNILQFEISSEKNTGLCYFKFSRTSWLGLNSIFITLS
jgi:hypothetical protein